ncbi:MAG: RNA polymerase sigma factor [Acidobacteria bacterium]|nr:MAG: RNA polymerase sigma factor [Acidobacteriota bacterium]
MSSCSEWSDGELARAASCGQVAAFEEIYHRHYRKVYGLCFHLLGNPWDAEDLSQEVFLRLYQKIGTFRGTGALATWLYRVTMNAVLMHLRASRRRHPGYSGGASPIESIGDGSSSRSYHAGQADELLVDRIDLERAMRRLPSGYRLIFFLHDVEGYGHEEIARMLGIATGTAKSQLHKARMRLRQLLRRRRLPKAIGLQAQARPFVRTR